MLAKKQRDTFFFFLDTISKVLKENQDAAKLDDLEKDMNLVLALLERDFPVGKQVSIVFIYTYSDAINIFFHLSL